jgi:hypothetical protein
MLMIIKTSLIQETSGVIQGTFSASQGAFVVIQMMSTRPFGHLGLWAPSSGV